MGKRITLSCEECGYTMDASIGGGLGSCMPTVIEGSLYGEELEKWKKLYEAQRLTSFWGSSYIGYCPTCKKLKNVFVVEGTDTAGRAVELGNVCSTCGTKYRLYEEEDIPCPSCGADKLCVQVNGLWD